jgi:type II secretory pathway pseudopilin PulG
LVELLIVIAIICLLLTILMPSLQHAKELARRVICLSNLRNMGVGLWTYAYAHGDFPVYTYDGQPVLKGTGGTWGRNRFNGTTAWQKMLPDLAEAGYVSLALGFCPEAGAVQSNGRTDPARWPGGWKWRMDHDYGHWGNPYSSALTNQGDYHYYGPGTNRYDYDHMNDFEFGWGTIVYYLDDLGPGWPGHWGGVHSDGRILTAYGHGTHNELGEVIGSSLRCDKGARTPLMQDAFLAMGATGYWWNGPMVAPHAANDAPDGTLTSILFNDGSVEMWPFR